MNRRAFLAAAGAGVLLPTVAKSDLFLNEVVGFGGQSDYSAPFSGLWTRAQGDRMTKSFGAGGNRKAWTFSTWAYLNDNSNRMGLFGVANDPADYVEIRADNKFQLFFDNGTGASVVADVNLTTSVWNHIVAAIDTTQGTAADRVHLYHGTLGTQATEVSYSGTPTYPNADYQSTINNATTAHALGDTDLTAIAGAHNYLDAIMAETVLIDGQQLTPSSFARAGRPIDLSGLDFGTTGFRLDYAASGDQGNDVSGLGNDWTNDGVSRSTTTPTN